MSKFQQIRIAPWFIATAEKVTGASNGYVQNFPKNIILVHQNYGRQALRAVIQCIYRYTDFTL